MKNSSSLTPLKPLISCIMPTYNRVYPGPAGPVAPLVEEAICSFVSQDYPADLCELIVLNDTPGQMLKDVPYTNVHVMNFAKRLPTLGDKCNLGIEVAQGKYVTRWDDDDISLPNRLKSVMDRVQQGDLDVLVVQGYFYHDLYRNEWQALPGQYGFQQDVYRREIALKVKYESKSNGEDQLFRSAMWNSADSAKVDTFLPTVEELSYIYRWGASPLHLSDSMANGEAKYQQIGEKPILELKSPYVLEPHWRAMYVDIVQNLIKKSQATDVCDQPGDRE